MSDAEKETNHLRDLYDLVEVFAVVVTIMILVVTFIARPAKVEGQSMEDTLHDSEYLIVSDLLYTPTDGDIVVVHNPSLEGLYGTPLVKRVIATGGQTVEIEYTSPDSDFVLKVDGEVVDEPYVKLAGDNFIYTSTSFTVPEGMIFVMGDNRNHSGDSRQSSVGFIDERCVIGKAIMRVFPFNKITVFS
jgi:signal peptidase I